MTTPADDSLESFGFTTAATLDDPKAVEAVNSALKVTPITAVPDFGFSLVHKDQFEAAFKKRESAVKDAVSSAMKQSADEAARSRMMGLREMFMPLLNKLMADADKEWIFWPKREERIKAFIEEMDRYIAS